MQAGECKFNPAAETANPRAKTSRARLTLDVFEKILKHTQYHWAKNAFLLALLSAQRLSDIGEMKFSQVKKIDGKEYLEVIQIKTGNKVRISLDLRLDVIGMSLRDAINQCRDHVLSPYMLHHTKYAGMAKPGSKVRTKSLSNEFRDALKRTKLEWECNPPSFHEIRSLAERLYDKEGINTQELLGHKHASQTAEYHDARGHDWVTIG
ncbi:MAG: tyrosine-type recombinase/integrase [Sedimenticola sp.]